MATQSTLETPRRVSIFRETGLFEDEQCAEHKLFRTTRSGSIHVRFKGENPAVVRRCGVNDSSCENISEETSDAVKPTRIIVTERDGKRVRSSAFTLWSRLSFVALVIAVALQFTHKGGSLLAESHIPPVVVEGGVTPRPQEGPIFDVEYLPKRANAPTNICKRWSHQSAIVNGTLYLYGGRATTDSNQNSDTWNNNLLKLDLTRTWQISSPSLTGLSQPSGPPAVANGFLWSSRNSLFLYGGEFSDNPAANPSEYTLWEYDIRSSSWKEHKSPKTSAGKHATGDGNPVQRAAEGAGVNAAPVGRGWYFGGHLDAYTTQGWSVQVARVYLKSLIEFTFPGSPNSGVNSLSGGKTAGSDGVWRNITEGGLQDQAGFTERADGVLLYVPGFGEEGILLGLAGGTNATFTQMNVIDVYDIATSTWYKQATSGSTPNFRVNPCATVAAAADGSSYNIYMFGGQNLLPYGEQKQYDDMWILSIPAFKWIQVDTSKQAVPYGRAGHSCNAWDGQMVVVGGYVGQDLSCDSPGIYIFNMSSLQWKTEFTSVSGDPSQNGNPFSQQLSQIGHDKAAGPEGSYGYVVPSEVYSAIGGGPTGGATITVPIQAPTDGPLATGKPLTYTVTAPGGVVTQTSYPGGGNNNSKDSSKKGAIAAGVIAAVLGGAATYFAFCAWIYRKQLKLYKHHVVMSQRSAADPLRAEKVDALFPVTTSDSSNRAAKQSSEYSARRAQQSSSGRDSVGTEAGPSGFDGHHYPPGRRSIDESSMEDLLDGSEPTFWGVALNPRKSLRVINRD